MQFFDFTFFFSQKRLSLTLDISPKVAHRSPNGKCGQTMFYEPFY